ncbi:hypothetical protein SAMN05192561_11268 [Halopenitus malekzadehii]|uniref:IraD/Gp25-like domain-containing protein n=1 Tax=Halopenitus malekzadehii TaxID=1267564 RepID=A0A1H6JKN6_9EURY|nr:hypothetical protein [Halopenitus malekzadehii]SEH61076.1 hypothetical protein SAMN05192561_11268 [Halopenitus malekzadehii]
MNYKRTLALNPDGSFRVENGSPVWIDGAAAVEQELRTMLATIRGEDPFDEDHGLPVFEISGSPPAVVERGVRNTLLSDDRVASVDTVDVSDPGANRVTDVDVQVTLVDGEQLEFTSGVQA